MPTAPISMPTPNAASSRQINSSKIAPRKKEGHAVMPLVNRDDVGTL
jgi:hypothetical protein